MWKQCKKCISSIGWATVQRDEIVHWYSFKKKQTVNSASIAAAYTRWRSLWDMHYCHAHNLLTSQLWTTCHPTCAISVSEKFPNSTMHVQIDLHDLYHYRSLLHVRHRINVQVFLNHSLHVQNDANPPFIMCFVAVNWFIHVCLVYADNALCQHM